jgi:hypothetical protein
MIYFQSVIIRISLSPGLPYSRRSFFFITKALALGALTFSIFFEIQAQPVLATNNGNSYTTKDSVLHFNSFKMLKVSRLK